MNVNKSYCINSFLQFRFVHDKNILFKEGIIPNYTDVSCIYNIKNSKDLDDSIKDFFAKNVDSKTALMLSSGIDSAILAHYMPKGSKTFTLKCIAEEPTIDETVRAKEIAELNGLDHEVIEITWEDYEKYSDILLKHKKAPFHSIEVQIYKAALRAKELGYNKLLFGESADSKFGGLNNLLSQDWNFGDFIERYNFVPTKKVLKDAKYVLEPFKPYQVGEKMDVHKFLSEVFFKESVNSYINACSAADIEFLGPYAKMKLVAPLDIDRIRNGDSKYLIKELFIKKYPNLEMSKKIPMPRPMLLWLKDWKGPKRLEFKKNCISELDGDQKWLIYILEKFLNYFEIE